MVPVARYGKLLANHCRGEGGKSLTKPALKLALCRCTCTRTAPLQPARVEAEAWLTETSIDLNHLPACIVDVIPHDHPPLERGAQVVLLRQRMLVAMAVVACEVLQGLEGQYLISAVQETGC